MALCRRFPVALAAALTTALPASLVMSANAGAAISPTWSAPHTLSAADHTGSNPRIASANGTVVSVWTEYDDDTASDVVMMSMREGPDGVWSTPSVLSGGGVTAYETQLIAGGDGNITAAWIGGRDEEDDQVWTRTLIDGEWTEPERLSSDRSRTLRLTKGPGGTVVASWITWGNSEMRLRAADSAVWGEPVDIFEGNRSTDDVALAYNASGNGIATWDMEVDGSENLYSARYTRSNDSWSEPVPVTSPGELAGSPESLSVAISPTGAATTVWTRDGVNSSSTAAGSMNWSAPELLTANGDSAFLTGGVVSDRGGDMITVYQSYQESSPYTTALAVARTRDAETGEWGDPEPLSNDALSGLPSLSVDQNYNIITSYATGADFSSIGLAANYRPDGEDAFTGSQTLVPGYGIDMMHGFSATALDESGSPVAVWPNTVGDDTSIGAAVGDASGPELNEINTPSTGTVGERLTFSVNPFDLWSDLGVTSWAFGDGVDATGTSVGHTYTAPGSYTVAVSSSDVNAYATSATRTVTITGPPAPPKTPPTAGPKPPDAKPVPPKVLAPVTEARLAGRTIDLNARVALRRGQRCRGKASAITRFGKRTYRTKLRLSTVNGRCIATGTIRLRKTPSFRTRLRIKISARAVKSRTVTTRR